MASGFGFNVITESSFEQRFDYKKSTVSKYVVLRKIDPSNTVFNNFVMKLARTKKQYGNFFVCLVICLCLSD